MPYDQFKKLRLRKGAGGSYENGLCVMEAVAWMNDEAATDHPECACPVIANFAIRLNDSLNNENRQQLTSLIIPITGTKSDEHKQARADLIVMRVGTEIVPLAFDAIGLSDHAAAMRKCTNKNELRAVMLEARTAATAAASAADAADASAAVCAADAATVYAPAAAAVYAADATVYAAVYAAAVCAADAGQETLLKCIPILKAAIELGPNGSDSFDVYQPRVVALTEFLKV